jgi:hypothetical protein
MRSNFAALAALIALASGAGCAGRHKSSADAGQTPSDAGPFAAGHAELAGDSAAAAGHAELGGHSAPDAGLRRVAEGACNTTECPPDPAVFGCFSREWCGGSRPNCGGQFASQCCSVPVWPTGPYAPRPPYVRMSNTANTWSLDASFPSSPGVLELRLRSDAEPIVSWDSLVGFQPSSDLGVLAPDQRVLVHARGDVLPAFDAELLPPPRLRFTRHPPNWVTPLDQAPLTPDTADEDAGARDSGLIDFAWEASEGRGFLELDVVWEFKPDFEFSYSEVFCRAPLTARDFGPLPPEYTATRYGQAHGSLRAIVLTKLGEGDSAVEVVSEQLIASVL